MAHDWAARGSVVGSGTYITFVPDVGSFVHICLESETYVCSFSSEFLFSFELLNLFGFSVYALLLPFCSSRSAPPFPLFPGSAPALLLAAIFRGRARRARAPIVIVGFFFSSHGSLWQPYEGNIGK